MNLLTPEAEQALREQVGRLLPEWREGRGVPFAGADEDDYAAMILLAQIAADEARASVQQWVDAARCAGMSWADIGELIGISKQAAQQRFGHDDPIQLTWTDQDVIVRDRVGVLAEMAVLQEAGADGMELIGADGMRLKFRQTDRRWTYRRVPVWAGTAARKGWTDAATRFPFRYLRRAE